MDLAGRVPIRRDWLRTLFRLAVAVVAAAAFVAATAFAWIIVQAIAGAGWVNYSLLTLALFLLVISPLAVFILLKKAWAKSCRASCPHCGKPLINLAPFRNPPTPCPFCGEFVEGSEGFLQTVAADRLSDTPEFSCRLIEPPVWPPGCCVCGQAKVRVEKFRSACENILIEVPHCAEHRHGADLVDGSPPLIRFRSYTYMRKFEALQQTRGDG